MERHGHIADRKLFEGLIMQYQQFITIGHETIMSVLMLIGPALIASLVIGLIIGIFQAATSINEATLTFVPKLVVVVGVLALSAPFMISTVSGFFQMVFTEVARVNR
jgi:flagellar biosynthetic protein FliQ